MKFNIIGFPKCGTSSLEQWLKSKGHDAIRTELIYSGDEGMRECRTKYLEYKPILITRKPIDRIWSLYHYDEFYKDMSFEEFKKTRHDRGVNFGVQTPDSCSDYSKYIKEWAELEPIIISLEFMKCFDDFPHINKNPNYEVI